MLLASFFGFPCRFRGANDSLTSLRRFHSFKVVVPIPNSFAVDSCVCPFVRCDNTLSLNFFSYAMCILYHFFGLILRGLIIISIPHFELKLLFIVLNEKADASQRSIRFYII